MNTTLNNGVEMPMIGLGVYKTEADEAKEAVKHALSCGYRLIDTASAYGNEVEIGKAIKESEIPRDELFITTKVWNDDQRNEDVMGAFERSLEKLDLDYVDMYLIHWPVKENYHSTWNVLEEIYQSGKAKSIGVSNFLPHHLDSLLESTGIVPAINQFECHPFYNNEDLIHYCNEKGIIPQAHTPLLRGEIVDLQVLKDIGNQYDKTPAQVILRWDIENGVSAIPKSVTPSRIEENINIFDFELTDEDKEKIQIMNGGIRFCTDPDNFSF